MGKRLDFWTERSLAKKSEFVYASQVNTIISNLILSTGHSQRFDCLKALLDFSSLISLASKSSQCQIHYSEIRIVASFY